MVLRKDIAVLVPRRSGNARAFGLFVESIKISAERVHRFDGAQSLFGKKTPLAVELQAQIADALDDGR
jgi:hypothetical protein